ncbi:hypothetical protein HYH02_002779 [Chlamydomonas schloesseri]|uniref:UDENN domain-containing protein n=1 Tax=Chlamydomonas schloesseri TaxID=2026947 RepID=A0A836BAC3_9CHLO|nr:hypothetical protein HYH02_002779 [Chlamydomonas schloesseri]|eukprot:KAG2452541.1 hypothetical protein HYH02_002779 [Chlamydomonas schloesseri]
MYLLFFLSRLRVEGRSKTPEIVLRYKADGHEGVDFNESVLNGFCYPLGADSVQPKEVQASEEYTFTLTHSDGAKRYTGFCRQIFPPPPRVGSKARYPQVLCIVAENPWCNFFFKVLQVAEQILKTCEGLLGSSYKELPLDSQLGVFITDLRKQLSTSTAPGEVLRVLVPNLHGLTGLSPPRYLGAGGVGDSLTWADDRIELQVPPDCGNGLGNSGIPLARLLFHVPSAGMLTLIASLLLERRILFVARSRDTVTAAVQAAQALIYPFKWHHIYLPILPRDLVDYLSAPMPFLVGLPSDMLPLIRHIPMSEVTTVDLDLQRVIPPGGGGGVAGSGGLAGGGGGGAGGVAADDGRLLPYGRQLAAALEAVFKTVRSPTEYESSHLITGVMQEYFVRLFGSYRRFIHDQAMEPLLRPTQSVSAAPGGTGHWRHGRDSNSRAARESSRVGGFGGGSADVTASPSAPPARVHDDMLRGFGYYFDQPSFVAHRRSETVRTFLAAMRHSQMYQMFIQERLEMVACGLIQLTPMHAPGPASQSFSYGPASGSRPRAIGGSSAALNAVGMTKSSSANNLMLMERAGSLQGLGTSGGGAPSSLQLAKLPGVREHGSASGDEGVAWDGARSGSGSCATPALDPFEQRVQHYPEQRRRMRERLRAAIAEAAPTGVGGIGGAGRLANKLRRHRRTDSEDLYSVQHQQMVAAAAMQQQQQAAQAQAQAQAHAQHHIGGSLHGGESMRRITTYPGIIDVSTPTLKDPASFFAEWDLHEDEDDESASPSPSPRERDHGHMRSWSNNSLQSADSGDVSSHWAAGGGLSAGAQGSGPGAMPGYAAGGRGGGGGGGGPLGSSMSMSMTGVGGAPGGRDRTSDAAREGTPLRKLSVPALINSSKSAYMSLKGMPSVDSPGTDGKTVAQAAGAAHAGTAGGVAGAAGPTGTRMAAFGSLFSMGSGGMDDSVAVMEVKGNVQVKTLTDGHRVYDGSLKDIMRLAATEAKNGLLNSLHTLASPRNSPRGKEKDGGPSGAAVGGGPAAGAGLAAGAAGGAERSSRSALVQQRQLAAAMAAAAAAQQHQVQQMQAGHVHGGQGLGLGPLHNIAQQASTQSGSNSAGQVPLPGMGPGAAPAPALHSDGGAGGGAPPREHAASVPAASSSSSSSAAATAPKHEEGAHRFSSFLSGLKDKVAGAGTKALGILPTPSYKPQTTGEKAAKFKAQLSGSGVASLLAGADGKLKQPHAPQRPLGLATSSQTAAATPWAAGRNPPYSSVSYSGVGNLAGGPLAPPPTPGWGVAPTPSASPAAPCTPPDAAPAASPPRYPRTQSLDLPERQAASAGTAGPGASGNGAPPNMPPNFTSASQLPLDWDPFGTGPAQPSASASSSVAAVPHAAAAGLNGSAALVSATAGPVRSRSTSPFAAAAHVELRASGAGGTSAGGASAATAGDAVIGDLLGLTNSLVAASSTSSCAMPAAQTSTTCSQPFDPFAVPGDAVAPKGAAAHSQQPVARLESAGSNDFAAFASAASPHEFPPFGQASILG